MRPGVDHPVDFTVGDEGGFQRRRNLGVRNFRTGDDASDRQPEFAGEVEVALVVGGDGHDRACAVAGQDVIGDPDRDALAVDRVRRVRPGEDAGLGPVVRHPLDLGLPTGSRHVGVDFGLAFRVRQLADQGVFGRHDHERGAVQRVGPSGKDAQFVAAGLEVIGRAGEDDLGALGSADPVGLHRLDRLGPDQTGEVEQLVGVLGGPQVPLLEFALLDPGAAAPAMAVRAFDLLAGQRAVVGAPVHGRLGAVGEAGFEEPQEDPLVPAVVLGLAGDDLGVPIPAGAHRAQLAAHPVYVLQSPLVRVDLVLDRGVLGRQAEGVEADRLEDVLAVHAVEAAQGVRRRLHVPVTDVQIPRRVVVHRQQVVLGPGIVGQVRVVEPKLRPAPLPSRLDGRWLVAVDAGALCCRHGGPLALWLAGGTPACPRARTSIQCSGGGRRPRHRASSGGLRRTASSGRGRSDDEPPTRSSAVAVAPCSEATSRDGGVRPLRPHVMSRARPSPDFSAMVLVLVVLPDVIRHDCVIWHLCHDR